MCVECGCGDPKIVPYDVHERLLADNDKTARHNREHFRDHNVAAINLMGSPGAGKTAILEATARALGSTGAASRVGVLTGDLATDNDANRLRAAGLNLPAVKELADAKLQSDTESVELCQRALDELHAQLGVT